MTDYYSLLAKAVANLPKGGPASARKAIYDRARQALVRQLRALGPALSEADIAREEAALESAIARLEGQFAPAAPATGPPKRSRERRARRRRRRRRSRARPSQPGRRRGRPRSRPRRSDPPRRGRSRRRRRRTGPRSARTVRPRSAQGRRRPRRVAAATRSPLIAPAPPPPRAMPPPRRRTRRRRAPPRPCAARSPIALARRPAAAYRRAPRTADRRRAPTRSTPRAMLRPIDAAPASIASPTPPPRRTTKRSGPARQAGLDAPRANPLPWIFLAVVVGVVFSVAMAAFLLRQKPQDLGIKEPPEAADAQSPASPAKIVERVGGQPAAPAAALPRSRRSPPRRPPPRRRGRVAGATAPPRPRRRRACRARRAPRCSSPSRPTRKRRRPSASARSSGARFRRSPGQPATVGVKAEADIPDLKMHAIMTMRKNADPSLPASHTIDRSRDLRRRRGNQGHQGYARADDAPRRSAGAGRHGGRARQD